MTRALTIREPEIETIDLGRPDGVYSPRLNHEFTWKPEINANAMLRALGYDRNPMYCMHNRKRFAPGSGWWCANCGTEIRR